MKGVDETTPFRWVATEVKPHCGWLGLGVCAGGIMAGCEIAGVHLIKLLVDSALEKDPQRLLPILGFVVGLMVVSASSRYLRAYASGKAEVFFFCRLRRNLVDHLTRLPLTAIKRRHSTDVISRLYEDTAQIAHFVGSISDYIYKILFLILSLTYLLFIDWKIALLTCVFVMLSVFFAERYSRSMVDHSREYQARIAESNGLIKDAVTGIDVLKAYNIEDFLLAKYKRKLDASLVLSLKMAGQFSRSISISTLSQAVPLLLCIFYCALLVMRKVLVPSQLVAYIQLIAKLIGPTRDLPNMIFEVKRVEGVVQRILELQREETERASGEVTIGTDGKCAIEFEDVTFAYDGATVLRDISFKIPTGKRSAIVGKSGCGKSTILNLISGLYTDFEGEIRVCGRSVRKWDLNSLRRQLSVVLQDTYLFPGTVEENIRYGNMGAEDEEIIEVSRAAMAHGFIEELTEGYEADLGERGGALSVGQRQRISLARALLKDASILLLDEPTSALDVHTEAELLKSLHRKTDDKTLVIVTHRISTVTNADTILVLEQGRLTGQGTHQELLEGNATYAELCLEQDESVEGRSV